MRSKVPRIAEFLLKLFLRSGLRQQRLGDFEEIFKYLAEHDGVTKAKFWYWVQTFRSIPKLIHDSIYWGTAMFNNYLKVAFRNFKKQKLFTFINISGLAIGIAACMIISLWVKKEISYDQFHNEADRIFRVEREITRDEIDGRWPITSAKYKQALINDIPEITNAVRLWSKSFSIKDQNNDLHRQKLFVTDNSFLSIFDFVLLKGTKENALENPQTMVLTESSAIKYFGTQDVLGKTLALEMDEVYVEFEITGIIKDISENSHIHFDMLISFSTYSEEEFTSWRSNYLYTYVLLGRNAQLDIVNEKLKGFIDQHLEPVYGDLIVQGRNIHEVLKLYLYPLTDIHLTPSENWELEPGGSLQSVLLFSSLGFLLLIVAGINFINLSTARANRRAKEVSLRKTLGAYQQQLKFQFLQESLLLTFIAAFIAMILLVIFIPIYNSIFGGNFSILSIVQVNSLLIFLGITLSIGLIAGTYPALYLAKFEPVDIIKGGQVKVGGKSTVFRRNMVVFQFTVSISLLIALSIMYQQINFINTKSIGFQKENIITLPARGSTVLQNFENFKVRLLTNSSILSVSGSADLPGDAVFSNGNLYNKENYETHFSSVFMSCDYDFISTYKIPMIAGRNFSKEFSTDTAGTIIINETAVNKLGITAEQAIGKFLYRGENNSLRIIGVTKDFNFQSLQYKIEPMVFFLSPNDVYSISVRVAPSNILTTIDLIRDTWQTSFPGEQFEYCFLDKKMQQLYESEQKTQNILIVFTVMSVLIACLGLLGLAVFMAEERTKEIGIRKTLGATVYNIFGELTRDYFKWILISTIIAFPLSYYLMNNWLVNFAYRIELTFYPFILSVLTAVIISLFTVGYHSIKAATANPIDSIKYE